MQTLDKLTLSSSQTAEIGASRKRLSDRLHHNAEVRTASALVNGCSIKRRFSPRLHNYCKSIVTILSRKPCVRGSFCPKFHKSPQSCPLGSSTESNIKGIKHIITPSSCKIFADSKSKNPDIPCRNPNFQRRLSPRLHKGVAKVIQKDVCENSGIRVDRNAELPPSSVSQVQRRLSPRLHQIPEDGGREYESKKSVLRRRVSPKLQSDEENEKQIPISSGHASEKRPYSGLHAENSSRNAKRSKHNYPTDTGCENNVRPSHLNGAVPAANDVSPGEITIQSKVTAKKPRMNGVAPVIAGRRIHARVKKTLRIFNAYYLPFIREEEKRRRKNEIETEKKRKVVKSKVLFVQGCSSKTFLDLPGLVCCDISNGQEAIRIPVTNLFDDATVDVGFTYIKTIEVAESVNLPLTTDGCACKGNCTNRKICSCAKFNGSDFPYVQRDGGRLVEAKDVVFECGPKCSCGPRCLNRTSQREIKYHLEVYRTPDKGWAVRSWDLIPSGAPVCEYVGLLRRSDDVDNMSRNVFIFEIDCWHTMNEIDGRERRFGNVAVSATNVLPNINEKTLNSTPEFCIDAGSRGNVSRFINHSCEPNLLVQCALSAHHDLRLARLVFFAAENIPPLQELTYDYGYALNSVVGPDGEVKALPCFCATADCRKRLY